MKKAEQSQYIVHYIYFTGNTYTKASIFRRQMLMQAGDIFSTQLLYKSLRSLSKLKVLEAVTLEDVEIKLNEEAREINFTITVREKQRSK